MLTIKQTILNISLLAFIATNVMAQQGTVSSGGVAIGTGGSATYSIGQVNYITATNASYRITQGLQQPFFCIPGDLLTPTVSIVAVPSGAISPGTSVAFTATAGNTGGGSVTYNFKVNSTSLQNGTSNIYTTATLTNGDAVTCTITVSGGTCLTTNTASSNTITMVVNNQVVATCSNNNSALYYGYSGDQTATIKAIPAGGVAPYTVSITMNRPLNCNVITSSGDELWTGIGGTTINNICPVSGPGLTPVSTGIVSTSGGYYSVTVTLMQDAIFTATITDVNGSIATCTTSIHAEDSRCFAGNSGNAKVTLCHQTGSATNPCIKMCVAESAVAAHLAHGDFLGNCTPNCVAPLYSRGVVTEEELISTNMFQVKVIPNPTDYYFTLDVASGSKEKIDVVVYDVLGRIVKRIEKSNGGLIRFGEDMKGGVYMAEIMQGVNKKIIKLVKQ